MFDKIIFYDQIFTEDEFVKINDSIHTDCWIKNPDSDNANRDVYDSKFIKYFRVNGTKNVFVSY